MGVAQNANHTYKAIAISDLREDGAKACKHARSSW